MQIEQPSKQNSNVCKIGLKSSMLIDRKNPLVYSRIYTHPWLKDQFLFELHVDY